MAAQKKTRTRKQIVRDFIHALNVKDSNLKEWAKKEGFSIATVYSVTRGQNQGTRGEGRLVAEKMGLIEGEQA